MGRVKAEGFSRSMIEPIDDRGKFVVTHESQVAVFGEKLPKQAIGVFVHPSLPGGGGDEVTNKPTRRNRAREASKV